MCEKEPKSPCCKKKMRHIADNVHFHYECVGCCSEYDLDGITKWIDKPKKYKKPYTKTMDEDAGI